MSAGFWTGLAAWALVVTTAFGAFLFGQQARAALQRYPRGHVPPQVRAGTALSIAGPVLVVGIGLLVGLVGSSSWLAAALATFVALVLVTAVGWALAPR